MKRHQLRDLIAGGESSTVEFKRKFTQADKIAREIIAFANTSGGFLLVGVDDDGSIIGVPSEKETVAQLTHAVSLIVPPLDVHLEIVEIEWLDVIVVQVPNSTEKPHRLLSDDPSERPHERKAFIRQGENTVTASKEMAKILSLQNPTAPGVTISIGDRERRLFTYLERHERASVVDFAKLVNISRRRASQILIKLVRAGVLHIHSDGAGDYYTLR
ncbi:MAG: ATP-binding protein [Candidatus Kapabacteria bacterium]|jgi:predicted HTH transcriptional regulator|nr:ATP-binding protein [Candidatus Kapabacteria bacterium]